MPYPCFSSRCHFLPQPGRKYILLGYVLIAIMQCCVLIWHSFPVEFFAAFLPQHACAWSSSIPPYIVLSSHCLILNVVRRVLRMIFRIFLCNYTVLRSLNVADVKVRFPGSCKSKLNNYSIKSGSFIPLKHR
jgi:hypothetical protein